MAPVAPSAPTVVPSVPAAPAAQAPQYPAPGYAACIPIAPGTPLPPGAQAVQMVPQQVWPQQGTVPAQPQVQPAPAASAAGKVNINVADVNALAKMPGMNAKKAQAAVAHREQNGPFKSCHALEDVNGIGKKTVEKLIENNNLGDYIVDLKIPMEQVVEEKNGKLKDSFRARG